MMKMSTNLGAVEGALLKFLEKAKGNVQSGIVKGSERVKEVWQENTPVVSGRAHNSVHVVPPETTDNFAYSDNQGHEFDGSLGITTGPLEAAVGSNVPYMKHLNDGSAKMQGRHMIEKALLEAKDVLADISVARRGN